VVVTTGYNIMVESKLHLFNVIERPGY